MTSALSLMVLILAFAGFMAVVWSVHALDGYAQARYGYAPFALPNAALMCIPSLLLLSVLSAAPDAASLLALPATVDAVGQVKLAIWALFLVAMLGLLAWRTNPWIGAYAALLMALAAPVVLMTVLFQRFAR
jgi:hypothetical protein